MTIFLVMLAGGAGAVARFVLGGLISARFRSELPFGTILVNVSGSLLMGLLAGAVIFHGAPAALQTPARRLNAKLLTPQKMGHYAGPHYPHVLSGHRLRCVVSTLPNGVSHHTHQCYTSSITCIAMERTWAVSVYCMSVPFCSSTA